jgi:hypothetical protein
MPDYQDLNCSNLNNPGLNTLRDRSKRNSANASMLVALLVIGFAFLGFSLFFGDSQENVATAPSAEQATGQIVPTLPTVPSE